MSYQAMAWAIEQDVESPSARCVLMSIANYANEEWCAWPKQELIAKEGVQSVDSVQRRMPDLLARGLMRRIKLKRFGRRTHDFYILKRSPYFEAPLDQIRPLLPSGCDVIEETEATANCGNASCETARETSEDVASHAAADSGSFVPAALPQSAVDVAAIVRQPNDEPIKNQENPPNPPSGGGHAVDEQFERDVTEAQRTYPAPISDLPKFRIAMAAHDPPTRQRVLKAMRGYAAHIAACEKKRRPEGVKHAHRWVAQGMWQGYEPRGEAADAAAQSADVEVNSDAGRAWVMLHLVAGLAAPLSANGCYFLKAPLSQRAMAFATLPDEPEWVFIQEAATQQVGAWRRFLSEALGKPIKLIRERSWRRRRQCDIDADLARDPTTVQRTEFFKTPGFLAPHPWPPKVDGTWSPIAPDIGCSDEELAEFTKAR